MPSVYQQKQKQVSQEYHSSKHVVQQVSTRYRILSGFDCMLLSVQIFSVQTWHRCFGGHKPPTALAVTNVAPV